MSLNLAIIAYLKKYVNQQIAGMSGITGGGEWSPEQYYKKGTIVTTQGKVYIAIQDTPSGIEIINSSYWSLLLENTVSKDYVDNAIQLAILNSWEEAI